jgi:hypothetical protein
MDVVLRRPTRSRVVANLLALIVRRAERDDRMVGNPADGTSFMTIGVV